VNIIKINITTETTEDATISKTVELTLKVSKYLIHNITITGGIVIVIRSR
jgi:hypothetical protein